MTEAIDECAMPWRRRVLRGDRLADLVFAGLLLLLLWVVYAPSLSHMPRADQWYFLIDTIDQHKFWDIFAHNYSYSRTRKVMPGDAELYRPLLFAVLAAEKAIFDADFAAYQAVGICLHWGVVCMLLLLLRTLQIFSAETNGDVSPSPSPWIRRLPPYGICLFFALNKAVQDLVIWTHLHGYLVFLMFLLASLILLLRYIRYVPSWKSPLLWGSWALALLSAFTYEMGQLYALMAGLFLAVALPRGTGTMRRLALCGLFAAVMVVYQGADRLDRRIHRGKFQPEQVRTEIKNRAFTKDTLIHSERFLVFTTVRPFFPSLWTGRLIACGRILLDEASWSRNQFARCPAIFLLSVSTIALAAGMGFLGFIRLLSNRYKQSLLVFLFALVLYGIYMGMTVLGRLNLRPGPYCLSFNSYYGYLGLLLALPPCFMLWQACGRNRSATLARMGLCSGMLVLTCYSAVDVRRLNESVAQEQKRCRDSLTVLGGFIERHRHERDFSIDIDFAASDFSVADLSGTGCYLPLPAGPACHFLMPIIVYKRWFRPNAKYIVAVRDGQLCARPRNQQSGVHRVTSSSQNHLVSGNTNP